ncbi:MAG TPA: peroxiredoxin-like family protein [Thermoanaerobaculia bacterium]|nr:peroxiredoxin-like family protein [Thermoanaerobaculia bacterium]
MRGIAGRIEELGARLVLIGNGTPEQGQEFLRETGELPFRLVLDPQLVGYRAAQLQRPLLEGVRPRTVCSFVRAWRRGLRAAPRAGDAHEMGGAFVIFPGRGVAYSFVCRVLGDHPSFEEILATLERRRAEPAGPAPSGPGRG